MISRFSLFIVLLALLSCGKNENKAQKTTPRLDTELMTVLDSMGKLDQLHRSAMSGIAEKHGWNSPEMDSLWRLQNVIDKSNVVELEKIISENGFPGRSLVGEDGSRAAFLILQHSTDAIMDKYYDMVVAAGKNGDLAMSRVAMYQDRVLMHRGEKQIYGTQIRSKKVTDPKSGESYDSLYVWPIENPAEVNDRRLSVGLNTPIEEYASGFGVDYVN